MPESAFDLAVKSAFAEHVGETEESPPWDSRQFQKGWNAGLDAVSRISKNAGFVDDVDGVEHCWEQFELDEFESLRQESE